MCSELVLDGGTPFSASVSAILDRVDARVEAACLRLGYAVGQLPGGRPLRPGVKAAAEAIARLWGFGPCAVGVFGPEGCGKTTAARLAAAISGRACRLGEPDACEMPLGGEALVVDFWRPRPVAVTSRLARVAGTRTPLIVTATSPGALPPQLANRLRIVEMA
jgi:hypothetical protein